MSREPQDETEAPSFEPLVAVGEDAPSLADKLARLRVIRRQRDRSAQLDEFLLRHADELGRAVADVRDTLAQLKHHLAGLLEPPWYPAIFLRWHGDSAASRAVVSQAGATRLVGCADDVDRGAIRAGDEVYLGKDGNAVVAHAVHAAPGHGETAVFERFLADARAVVRWRDEELIVGLSGSLREVALQRGDHLRWDRAAWLALERVESAQDRRFVLDDVPDVDRDCVGGQDAALDTLLDALTASLIAPELAASYGLGGRHSILMYGPPGCGKTLMARVAAARLQQLSGRRCRIGVVKPAEWESPYVGETQANIRRCFADLRAAAADAHAILFLDEIESIGRIRGAASNVHADKFLAALLAELDGFTDRSGVAIIAATNRKDLVDPALLQRLSDVEIAVGRPRLDAARAIFAVHLTREIPYSPNGAAASATRDELIDTAVSRLYGPNADNALCTLRFRDGATRVIAARELVSGRLIEQVCRAARRAALLRDIGGGGSGVRRDDVEDAVSEAIARLATTLTRHNAHQYLSDLPQDVDVVSVDPIARRPERPHRYLVA
ncbi:MAG: AAA family ATPase [Candidatus Binatia bacterium]